MTRHLIGAHTVDTGGMDMAMRRASRAGMSTMQLFTAIPKFYGDKSNVSEDRVRRFRAAAKDTGLDPARFVTHGAYVLNTGTPDADKWTRARDGLTKELERSSLLGIGIVCFHPGAATDGDRVGAAERIAGAIMHALEQVDSKTRILIENTAGAGSTMARTSQEVGMILANIPRRHRARTGYGLDTCHLYASGYDIAKSRDELTRTLDAFEAEAGEAPGFFHLNDSEGALGSNRDRHALLGKGLIGAEPFRWLLADRRSRDVPLILEHNQKHPDPAPDDDTPDPYDLDMMELLRRFSE
ncbi:MAG TPA: deoxyribonuclease IV [Gemmatimonadaceae bacterium]|nr:deoxyribonuclease IV [Gemmatimonadaceae bacterium]